MSITTCQIGAPELSRYATIPMTLEVKTIYQIHPINNGLGGLELREIPVNPPYI